MPFESCRSTGRGSFTCRTSFETGARFMRTMPRKDVGATASGSCATQTVTNTRDEMSSFSMLVSFYFCGGPLRRGVLEAPPAGSVSMTTRLAATRYDRTAF